MITNLADTLIAPNMIITDLCRGSKLNPPIRLLAQKRHRHISCRLWHWGIDYYLPFIPDIRHFLGENETYFFIFVRLLAI